MSKLTMSLQLRSILPACLEALCYVNRSYGVVNSHTHFRFYQFSRTERGEIRVVRQSVDFTGMTAATESSPNPMEARKQERNMAWLKIFKLLLKILDDVMIEQRQLANDSLMFMVRENGFKYRSFEEKDLLEEYAVPLHFWNPFSSYRNDDPENKYRLEEEPFTQVCCHVFARGQWGRYRNEDRWEKDGYCAMDG